MKYISLSFVSLLLCLTALAGHSKKRETYPGVVDDDGRTTASLGNQWDEWPFKQHKVVREQTDPASPKSPQAGAAPQPTAPLVFDPVPREYVDSIAGRLQIVERILRNYGRAYDYRALTTEQLQTILSQLEHEKPVAF